MHCVVRIVVLAMSMWVLAPGANAQPGDFPSKAVTIVSPYAPGGGNDIVSRLIADQLRKLWNQPVLVENRPGAGGNLGTGMVAKAAPDGYTLVMGSLSYPINASLYTTLPFDPMKDLVPVSLLASGSYLLVSHPSLPVKTVKELVALAKSKPEPIPYASAGNGAGGHLGMEMFKAAAGIDLLHVPYRGTGPAMNDTIAGQVMLDMDNVLALGAQVKGGRLRALAVTSLKRSSLFPEVPTMHESGFPGFEVSPWFGLLAPAGTPRSVVEKISADCAKILALPEVKELLRAQGAEPEGNTPDQFTAYLSAEIEKWRKVVKATGARID
jgi:tripartite-type tricarboxylate transporter receptor subunit TctC